MDRCCGERNRRVSLGLVCLVLFVIGNVQSEEVCRTGCKGGAAQTFKYAVGTTYKYSYDGKIEVSLSSAEGQVTSTEVKADVLLTQQGDCNQILRLQNVQIIGSNGKRVGGSIPDIEKPIRININDGVLDDSICVVDGDNQNSINVKRAIASIFQASLKSGYETDVFGTCPTDSSSHKEGNILVITKSRNLNKCSYREHIQQDFLATAFNLHSEIKSSPLLNGEYSANLRVKNGILEQATIKEDYLYVPFSVGKNGAKANIISKLQYSGTAKDSAPAPVTKPRSIIFENPHPINAPNNNVQNILSVVKEVAQTIDIVVGETTAREFVNLLKIVKVSKKNDLLAVYNQVKSGVGVGDKDAAKRIFLDALLRSGNGDSVEAILELLKQNELGETDARLALLGLNFVRHATEGSVRAAAPLLDRKDLPRETYLGIGNIAGHYCRQHSCENNAAITALTNKFLAKLGTKATNREQERDLIFALKGLANFHHLNDNVLQKLISIAQGKDYPNRVRVAALETFLADPCKDKLRNRALNILEDIQQDSEIRIKAYLVLAQCPNAKIGNAVKTLLEKEQSIQVGGFITSHIRSIKASANPDKALAQQHLGFSLKKRFPIDPRKYSFNGEFSYAVDTLGFGASSEATVIYSQNSWLPRSSSLNLTAQIFGHNFNFLEIETRQENLDRLVEHYFGPKGVLQSSRFKDVVEKSQSSFEKLVAYADQKLGSVLQERSKRDVSKAEIEHIAKQVQIKTSELNKDLDLDVSLRAFGSEVFFLNLNQRTEKITPEAIIDDIVSQLSQGLDRLNNFQETLRENILFLDAEFDYPTSLGFPLRLAAEGSATIQVKAEGSIDARKLINSASDGQLKLKLIPSANIEVSGRLTLDALVVENGLKVVSTLYSSTGGDLNLSWERESGFNLRYGLPVQEQKIISANHEIVFVSREQAGREHNLPLKFTQVKDFSICLDQLSPFIGLTFCAEVNNPNLGGEQIPILPFPLAGDAKIAVTIENNDVSEYRIKQNLKGNPTTHADLILETIGKDNQRKVALELSAEHSPEQYIRAAFSSAVKTASAELRIISTNVEQSLQFKVTHDQDVFSGKMGLTISGTPERTVYKPILEYRTPAGEQPLPIKTEGQIIVERNGPNIKYIYDNIRVSDDQTQFSLNGNLGLENGIYFTDLTFNDGQHNYGIQGRLQLSASLIKFNVKYESDINKAVNFNLKGEFKRQDELNEHSIQLIHGNDLNSKINVLTLKNSFINRYKSPEDFKWETKNSISYPLLSLSGKFELEHTPKEFDYDVEFQYGELKLGSELDAKIDEKTAGDYDIDFEVYGLDNKLELSSKRQVLPNDESKISHTLEINGRKYVAEGKIKHLINPSVLDIGVDLTLRIPSETTPLKISYGLKVNVDELDLYEKISLGNENIIDIFLKADKKGNANGSLKVNIKNTLTINGQIHANNGAGNGEILINIPNAQRQIKGVTNFNIQPSKSYDFSVTLYPSFSKDQNQKLFFSTKTQVTETSIDSKNQIELFGDTLDVNIKGSGTGDDKAGKFDGEVEVLSGEAYLALKGSCDHKEENDVFNGQTSGFLEYRPVKNSLGYKFNYKGNWRNTNYEAGIIDVDYTLSWQEPNGRDINTDISLKTTDQNGVRDLKYNSKLYGNSLKYPSELSIFSQSNQGLIGQYEIKVTEGPANTLNLKGSYDVSQDNKKTGNIDLQFSNDYIKILKTLNVDLRGSLARSSDKAIQVEGSANIFADDDGTNPNPIIDLKSQGSANIGVSSGQLRGNIIISKIDPITVATSYNLLEDNKGGSGSIIVTYGGQTIKFDSSLQRSSDHQYKLTAGLQTPVDGFKNTLLSVDTKRSDDNKSVNSAVELSLEGKVWKAQSDVVLSDVSPSVDLKVTNPEGKHSQIYAKGTETSSKQFSGELKLINELRQFSFDGAITVNAENLDDLLIKGRVDSPNLNLNKITFEAHNKGSSSDRKIQILVKSAGKNLISGTTSYSAKEENGKFIVEGSGQFKVREETKSGNFKYIVQELEEAKNGEVGFEVSFDAGLGNEAIDSEFKITNKHFRFQNSYCEQKKECAYIEIDDKINSNDVNDYNEVLEINLDLRKLGLSHEFGLKAVTTRKDWVIDHTVDAHFQNQENSKYQYSVYIHPRQSGVSFTTPKRIIALEAKFNPPKNIKEGGRSNGDISFYIDKKNHPNRKTALTWSLDVDPKGVISGQSKFTHPGLKKPLGASFKAERQGTIYNGNLKVVGELDVFAQENQKIVTTYQKSVALDDAMSKGKVNVVLAVQSKGLDLDIQVSESLSGDRVNRLFNYEEKVLYHVGKSNYDSLGTLKWSDNEISALIKVLNKELFRGVHKFHVSQQDQIVDTEVLLYGNSPIVSRLEIKNYNTLTYSVGYKNSPNNKLVFNAGLIPEQIADVRLDYIEENAKTNLFYLTVKLDEANLFDVNHELNSRAISQVLEKYSQYTSTYVEGLKGLSKEWTDEAKAELERVGEITKKAAPNLEPLRQYYNKELQEFKTEILNDKSIKELGEAVTNVVVGIATAFTELFENISKLAEESAKILQESFADVLSALENGLIPTLKEISALVLRDLALILEMSGRLVTEVLVRISITIEELEPELKELTAIFRDLGQDLGKVIQSTYQNIRENLKAIYGRVLDELKASPYIDELKAEYDQFVRTSLPAVADAIINTIREIANTIKDVIPQEFAVKEDINTLLDLVTNYVEQKLQNKPVDDVATFEQIAKTVATIVNKIVTILSVEGYQLPGAKVDSNSVPPLSYFQNLPRLAAVKFSLLNYLLDEDLPGDVVQLLLSLVNSDNVLPPFSLYGIIQGQNIFTLDGRYISFPGSCNYLFVRDAVNGNFTLAGSYKDGHLVSITLADKTGFVTLLQGGKVKLDNANTELPARKPEISAFRDYELITLMSKAGVRVDCTPDLIGCSVSISGFYHGQLRGLLGNGNYERYDDFTLPNGNVVTAGGEFVNSYKLTAKCGDVKPYDQIPDNPTCNKLFSWEESWVLCYSFVPVKNFKAACALGLANKIPRTEESIAKAYVAACQHRGIPVDVPESLLKCTNSDKAYSVGDTFKVKLPSKSADIVLIVDTEKKNKQLYEKLVQPLVPEIIRELKDKGITDVEFHLITYGGPNQWPSHVTVNGKLTFKGKPPALKFGDEPEDEFNTDDIKRPEIQELTQQIKEAFHDIALATGLNLKSRTFDEAYKYPFRANALKSIIVVNGEACEVGKLYPIQKLFALTYTNSLISLNLFTPLSSLSVKSTKEAKRVVGFSDQRIFTLGKDKKGGAKGNTELYKELNYEDYCVDFTINNRGNAFINNNFQAVNEAEQKQFVSIAAANIVEQLINVEQGLTCECELVNPWQARNVCEEDYIKERQSKKV